ncbi:hypothetical protein PhCBS80983_g03427 [Powellomyces hirtus]|uniref:Palmitoyltransferase n=1 Tax=Powellomyces hirtus TaxID=109895 RepID=A0A507E1S0_9FUNG|nr:hypothetical protein PhCBS80983_g03427 [Powellomyces hirtus]
MLADDDREPLLQNLTSTLTHAASVVGSTVTAVASAEPPEAEGGRSKGWASLWKGGRHGHGHDHSHAGHGCRKDETGNLPEVVEAARINREQTRTIRGEEMTDFKDILNDGPPELDLFQAAQQGLLSRIRELLEDGRTRPTDVDTEKCTALHWAAINNHIAVAEYLIEKGAELDAIGGELQATPLHWAARFAFCVPDKDVQYNCGLDINAIPVSASRSGHIQMVYVLSKAGANPALKDNQGYNALHLAAHAGHALMAVYLIASGMDIDSPDGMARTALMWSAYQGNSYDTIIELVRSGANVDLTDSTGYTALHWAVISNHMDVAKDLLKLGVRTDIKDPEGKTPGDWATERGQSVQYQDLLRRTGRAGTGGHEGGLPFDKVTTNRIIYIAPFVIVFFSLYAAATLPFYFSIPTICFMAWMVHAQLIVRYLMAGEPNLVKTPFLTAIPQATLFYVFAVWVKMVPYTGYLYPEHIFFLGFFSVCIYSLYKSVSSDPGYIPVKSVEDRKLPQGESWMLAPTALPAAFRNLCEANTVEFVTAVSSSLTSKSTMAPQYSIVNPRLHQKEDGMLIPGSLVVIVHGHTIAVIGALNHRYFMLFTGSLCLGAWMFFNIDMSYLNSQFDNPLPPTRTACTLPVETICKYFAYDGFAFVTGLWTMFNSTWCFFLFLTQAWQIGAGYTTNESANWHRFNYLVEPSDWNRPAWNRRMKNVFNRGLWGNCNEFWGQPPADPCGTNKDGKFGKEESAGPAKW